MNDSKNNIAWEKLFDNYKIIEKVDKDGSLIITSKQINQIREARLMTKFDHKSQLPKLFQEHNLSILPTSRGGYLIGTFNAYCDFNTDDIDVEKIKFPQFLESLNYREITSETTAINCALVTKILHNFTGEDSLVPTVSGRMGSSSFSYIINTLKGDKEIFVDNSQIEIDAGFEGDKSLILIEGKNFISNDFLIRQLFYPYKLWTSKIRKKVKPLFLTYSNGVFHLREYKFTNINHYNSIELIKHRKYVVHEGSFNIESIEQILNKTKIVKEPNVPFPQANNFDRVINLCELLNQRGFIAKDDITANYYFASRQTDYYTNAAIYLGLVRKVRFDNKIGCVLSEEGKRLFSNKVTGRQAHFVSLILSHSVFNKTLRNYLEAGVPPSKSEIVDIMKIYNLANMDRETLERRASTIIGWVNWIIKQIEEE